MNFLSKAEPVVDQLRVFLFFAWLVLVNFIEYIFTFILFTYFFLKMVCRYR